MSVNKVILVGNAGRDPEVRYLDGGAAGSGTKMATFTLATSERFKDRNGEMRESTEWHNIVAWRQNADVCEKFVRKGAQLYIEGKLRTRSYTDASGVKKNTTDIQVDTLQLLGRREGTNDGAYQPQYAPTAQQPVQQSQPAPQYAAPAYQAPQPRMEAPVVDDAPTDDLPF